MGGTGTGKTSFISALTGQDEGIVHGLSSGTTNVAISNVECKGQVVQLIDTPGFNGTWQSDDDILREIAFILSKVFVHNYQVIGVLYLHRISDNRISGSTLRGFRMLEKICGFATAPRIFLVSTMWNQLHENIAARREAEARMVELRITHDYWQPLSERGSRITRFWANTTSAVIILADIIDLGDKLDKQPLQIQRELVIEDKGLYETGAGRELLSFYGITEHVPVTNGKVNGRGKNKTNPICGSRTDLMISLQSLADERERAYRGALEQIKGQRGFLAKEVHRNDLLHERLQNNHQTMSENLHELQAEWTMKKEQLDRDQRLHRRRRDSIDRDFRELKEEQRHVEELYDQLDKENKEQLERVDEAVQVLKKREVMKRNLLPFLGILAGGGVIAAGAVTGITPLIGVGTGLAISSIDKVNMSRRQGGKETSGYLTAADLASSVEDASG
ncbi:hypothetical protein NPX13_g2123 [Xylaria arbuscula]|uniref:G domain-containing protein n=1 Tax=Xylaria arbuscula TaxID=114810 RepID=A0A9W8NKE0_9PEZI|nr:hypothetical protein NPX13_g2123 [Xylaria arbuscula]